MGWRAGHQDIAGRGLPAPAVEDPEVADACSILLSDSLLAGQFDVSTILHMHGSVSGPDRTSVYYKKLLYRLTARLFPNYARYFFHLLYSNLCRHNCRKLSMELGFIGGGLITAVHSLIMMLSLPVYQVRLDWLPLPYCLDLIQPAELPR